MKISTYETHPAADVFPLLGGQAFDALVEDIRTNGLREPVILSEGMILDGRSRLLACIKADVAPRFETFDGDPWTLSWSANVERRHLEPGTRAVYRLRWEADRNGWDARRQERKTATDEARQEARRDQPRQGDGTFAPTPTPKQPFVGNVAHERAIHAKTELAQSARVSPRTAQKAITVRKQAPELFDAVANGKLSLNRAYRETKQQQTQAERHVQRELPPSVECDVHVADVRSLVEAQGEHLAFRTVDLILTDPPYGKEHLGLYIALAQFASRYLRDGGSLAVMCGQAWLPDVFLAFAGCGDLRYNWTLAYLTPGGQSPQIWPRKVNSFWKPVLWFVRSEYDGRWLGDVAKSATNDNDKRFHDWGQSESGMLDLLERLSLPNDLVCDPFVGGGTTAAVCKASGRRFVGFDVDEQAVERTRRRLDDLE